MGRVEGKVALVTGGASGIGRATAGMLAAEGARVVIGDVVEGEGKAAAAESGGRFIALDVRDEEAWKRAIGDIVATEGRLDILANIAGVLGDPAGQDPERTTLEEFRRVNEINLEGVFLGCKTAIAAMRESGGGAIVNMSSIAGIIGTPVLAAYGAGKAGVRQITKSVALHCARSRYGIRCNSIHPGVIQTRMADDVLIAYGGNDPDAAREIYYERIPLGAFGEPDDIAHGVVYLASDESKYMTGAELVIDGGLTCY